MRKKLQVVALVAFLTPACYDFSLPSRDSGQDTGTVDGDIVSDNYGITGIPGDEGNTGAGGTTIANNGVPNVNNAAGNGGANASTDAGLIESLGCDSESCADGCCAGSTCVQFDSQSKTQCGAAGGACKSCPASLDCGSTGACGCSPTSCPKGCCADDKCVPYDKQSKTQCGAQGAACQPSGEGQACGPNGTFVCSLTTCPNGCCKDNKCVFVAKQSHQTCGTKGNACGPCGTGETCQSGVCSCGGNSSCAGCCSKGDCVASSNTTCGVGGVDCVHCGAKQNCNSQGKCVCDSNSCPSGCCSEDNQCQTPSATACGTGGEPCVKCSLANATASCSGGECAVASCSSGYGDCNGDGSDGCEVYLLGIDVNNCGTCRNKCDRPANANEGICKNGKCGYGHCNSGYDDCNGNASDGCEVYLLGKDVNNCGKCKTTCNLAHANSACSSGECVIESCARNYCNSDNDDSTGCEVFALGNDPNNCGMCKNTCKLDHASSSCSSGKCVINYCTGVFDNCNPNDSDGCETNLAGNIDNCGTCGNKCDPPIAGQEHPRVGTCSGGSCRCPDSWSMNTATECLPAF